MVPLLDHQAVLLEAPFMNRWELETRMDRLAFHRLILQQIPFRHKSEHIVREERIQVATRVVSAKSRCVELSIKQNEELIESQCDATETSSCSECSSRSVKCQFTKETNRRMSSIK